LLKPPFAAGQSGEEMTRGITIGLLLGLLLLAGCGSSGGSQPDPEATAIERKIFIEEADQICEDSSFATLAKVEAWERSHGIKDLHPNNRQLEYENAHFRAPSVLRRIEEVEALETPIGDEARLHKVLGAFRNAAERVEQDPSLQVGYPNAYTPVKKLTKAYGFVACGTG
jgi:hypothetical protein